MRFLIWRERHVKEKTFVIFLSLVVGVLGGFAALILKSLIHLISGLLTSHLSVTEGNYLFFIYPVVISMPTTG